jgi:two-component system nitrogen regulation response regulator GlnG/two-component system response regulator HydG
MLDRAEGGRVEISRAELEAALAEARGNVTQAARRLGLKNRYVLYRLMKRHDITPPEEPSDD